MAMKSKKPKSGKSEAAYNRYFVPVNCTDESASLRQPSPLKEVRSFVTYGISDDLFIHRRVKHNA